ncbi:MAG: dienelactone hydrolase family protein [Anaerolineales bacterium]|nr:dienelactone hydrolase family protein [Anaerolineales bacterium]
MNGKDLTFDVNGQPVNGYLALPSQADAPGVLVLHAWWGLNSTFKSLCDRLAAEGFVAFAPDLNSGRVAKTIDEAKQIMEELPFERKVAVAAAAPDFLKSRPEVRNEALSVIGFSMGAAWSLVLASEYPKDINKLVLFYGAGEADYSKMKVDILGHFAEQDEWEDEKYINAMQSDMEATGLKPVFHKYPNTSHWFFESDRPEFNAEAAQLAWSRTLTFLKA